MHRAHAQQQPRGGNSITNLSDMNFITERFPAASHKLHEVAHSFPQAFHPNVLPTLPWGAEGTGAGLTSVGLVVGMSVTPPSRDPSWGAAEPLTRALWMDRTLSLQADVPFH